MRFLICPTAFKGTLSAGEAAEAMERGVARARPDAATRRLPLSDGGPGLIDALEAAEDARLRRIEGVAGPAASAVTGRLLRLDGGRTAVVESADACGLAILSPPERDPLSTHTRGVGELLREAGRAPGEDASGAGTAARAAAPDAVIVGLGGSATCDGGVGAARRFGFRFLDARGEELPDGGGALADLEEIRPAAGTAGSGPPDRPELLTLADVDNPLLGPEGAAATYAPQKGADRVAVDRLEAGLRNLVEVAARDLRADPGRVRAAARRPGAGAAGGLAFGLDVFLGARVVGGAGWVLRRLGFQQALSRADAVVTGEGSYDATSARGKVVGEVVRRARASPVPVCLVCGRVRGRLPTGVTGEDGEGVVLDAGGIEAATARAVRRSHDGG